MQLFLGVTRSFAILFLMIICSVVLLDVPAAQASQGAASVGCDKDYDKERATFKKLFDAGKYEEAENSLEGYKDSCDWILDKRVYWIYSDLAAAAIKAGDFETCRRILDEADQYQKDYGPAHYVDSSPDDIEKMTPPPAALKALNYNRQKCPNPPPPPA